MKVSLSKIEIIEILEHINKYEDSLTDDIDFDEIKVRCQNTRYKLNKALWKEIEKKEAKK